MYYQHRKTRKKYASFPKNDVCEFCDPKKYSEVVYEETEHAYVIPNRTFYDHWELRKITDHRLIIPKSHVLTLADLNKAERADVMDIIADYESRDYEIYARAPGSSTRSVPHQHTHLIKAESKAAKGLFFLRKPYILWLFR